MTSIDPPNFSSDGEPVCHPCPYPYPCGATDPERDRVPERYNPTSSWLVPINLFSASTDAEMVPTTVERDSGCDGCRALTNVLCDFDLVGTCVWESTELRPPHPAEAPRPSGFLGGDDALERERERARARRGRQTNKM